MFISELNNASLRLRKRTIIDYNRIFTQAYTLICESTPLFSCVRVRERNKVTNTGNGYVPKTTSLVGRYAREYNSFDRDRSPIGTRVTTRYSQLGKSQEGVVTVTGFTSPVLGARSRIYLVQGTRTKSHDDPPLSAPSPWFFGPARGFSIFDA